METTIENMVEAYICKISKYKPKRHTDVVINLFKGDSEKTLKRERDFIFLHQYKMSDKMKITNQDTADCIVEAVKESLKIYPKNKKAVIDIYKDFLAFINKNFGLKIQMTFPDWLPTNTLERQLHIVKLLQDPKNDVSTLQIDLCVSGTTIENDLKKLNGGDGDPLEVLGQKLVIDFDRQNLRFPSTVHPLFLTFNLTQIITMLEGLKMMSEDSAHKNYALNAARTIWAQLSNYATRRIFTVSEDLGLDVRWYQSLNSAENNLFYSETMCSSRDRCENAFYFCKNQKRCYIEYLDDDGKTVYYEEYLIKSHDRNNNTIIIDTDGKEIHLNSDRVMKAALTKYELLLS